MPEIEMNGRVGQPRAGHAASSAWLAALRRYLGAMFVGNLIWEFLQLPLYTIWTGGTLSEQAFAAFHCTLGDMLIGVSSLTLALILIGDDGWPRTRFWPIAILTIALGVGYTIFSEWLNVVVRRSWAYSEWMPVVPLFGLKTGLSPLLQWMVIPAVALQLVRKRARWPAGCG